MENGGYVKWKFQNDAESHLTGPFFGEFQKDFNWFATLF